MSAPQNRKAKEFFTEWSTSPSKGAEQQDYKRVTKDTLTSNKLSKGEKSTTWSH